jgi:hypothetical protein
MLPNVMKTWVKEHEPEDGLTSDKLAGQYLNACKVSECQGNRIPE